MHRVFLRILYIYHLYIYTIPNLYLPWNTFHKTTKNQTMGKVPWGWGWYMGICDPFPGGYPLSQHRGRTSTNSEALQGELGGFQGNAGAKGMENPRKTTLGEPGDKLTIFMFYEGAIY